MSLAEMPRSILAETLDPSEQEPARLMTLEEMLALPEVDVDRELFEGRLVERPMTLRNRWHSGAEARLARLLCEWLETLPEPRGQIHSGEAGFRIRRNPDTSVGIDVAYVSAEVIAATPETSPYFEGPPILAVEILSPSNLHGEMVEKIRAYLDAGVALVWLVDPYFRTVIVYRPDVPPQMFNVQQELSGEPHLPGFKTAVTRIFSGSSST
jgi:Uma2 family endonuclease